VETALPWRIFFILAATTTHLQGLKQTGWVGSVYSFNLFDIFVLPIDERFVGGKKPLWQKLPG
jgi:hypothetical protein